MRKLALLLGLVAALFFAANVQAAPRQFDDPNGGTNSYCGPSVVGKAIWTYSPFDGWGYYVCEDVGYTLNLIRVGRCQGCSNDAQWVTGYSGGFWANTTGWVKHG